MPKKTRARAKKLRKAGPKRPPARKKARAKKAARGKKQAPANGAPAEQEARRAKFELGPPELMRALDARERAQTIPWGYGRDKVVALAVDPERLYVYWEVTDEAIARARAGLGPGGGEAGLQLRVHDVTGLLFDGSNSHHHLDLGVARSDRQWFVQVGRPASTAVVELGLRARDGAFAKIARSHRVDFPRRDPAPPGPVEWMTVRVLPAADGRPGFELTRAAAAGAPRPGAAAPACSGDPADRGWDDTAADDELLETGVTWSEAVEARFESIGSGFHEWFGSDFWARQWELAGSSWEWHGPLLEERWASAPRPFETLLAPSSVVVEVHDGGVTVQTAGGVTRVRRGPWRVTIRRLDARGGGRVLARWEIRRAWVSARGRELTGLSRGLGRAQGGPGSSWSGASERRWIAGSESRLGGASEQRWLGASEQRLRGASEQRLRGASERRLAAGSEGRLAAGSERRLGGSSATRAATAGRRGSR